MSDENNSGGIIGTIISILILAAIWPYLLALLGLYIAYMVAVAVLDWMSQNPLIVVSILLGTFSVYAIFRYKLIPMTWKWLMAQILPKAKEVALTNKYASPEMPDLAQRKFLSSTNLYCYWCAKKLGIKSWEKGGKYYCDNCRDQIDAGINQ